MPLQIVKNSIDNKFVDYVARAYSVSPSGQKLGDEPLKLRSYYYEELRNAINKCCKSIAIPFVDGACSQVAGRLALDIALDSIREFLYGNQSSDEELMVYLVVNKKTTSMLTHTIFPELSGFISPMPSPIPSPIARKNSVSKECSFLNAKQDSFLANMFYDDIQECCSVEPETEIISNLKISSLDELLKNKSLTFSQRLLKLLDEKGINDVAFYKRANIDRKLFSKIRNVNYKPSKNTVLAAIIGLRLNEKEAAELMAAAGYAWNDSDKTDIIVRYFISNGFYDIDRINWALFDYGEKILGAKAG